MKLVVIGSLSLKLGYAMGTVIFTGIFVGLVAAQVRATAFHRYRYWATIVGTTTLGTTIADLADRSFGLGYPGGVGVVFALLMASLGVWYWSAISHTALFWVAFILTRPLGATLGDLLDKPVAAGGMNLSRLFASLVLLAFIGISVWPFPQRTAQPGSAH